MKLLAIDTTEAACSAALLVDNEVIERFEIAPRRHSELILPMMDALLQEAGFSLAQLDALAFARGPGSFTGVRIATAVVQGAATAAGLPVVPVSSLLALAQGAMRSAGADKVLAGFDARMHEVYWAACTRGEDGLATLRSPEQVCAPDAVPLPGDAGWVGVGSAWESYAEPLQRRLGDRVIAPEATAMVHAQDVARLARAAFACSGGVPAEQALPVYLRDQVARKMRG
jgi:tRNA threonylcarbamoyladenosine biosynthesis protein TsaB